MAASGQEATKNASLRQVRLLGWSGRKSPKARRPGRNVVTPFPLAVKLTKYNYPNPFTGFDSPGAIPEQPVMGDKCYTALG